MKETKINISAFQASESLSFPDRGGVRASLGRARVQSRMGPRPQTRPPATSLTPTEGDPGPPAVFSGNSPAMLCRRNHGVNNTDILGNANSLLGSSVSGHIGCRWRFCGGFNSVYFSNSLTKHCFRRWLIGSSQLFLFPFPLVSRLHCRCKDFPLL